MEEFMRKVGRAVILDLIEKMAVILNKMREIEGKKEGLALILISTKEEGYGKVMDIQFSDHFVKKPKALVAMKEAFEKGYIDPSVVNVLSEIEKEKGGDDERIN